MKGLILAHASSQYRISAAYGLRGMFAHWGIDTDVRVTADVHALGGKSYINANYDFAIVIEYRKATDTGTTGNEAYSWLAYSAGDKPIFYLGGQVRGSVPSDFPVIAFNSGDSSTYYQTEVGQVATDEVRRIGSCVMRPDGSAYIWGRFANYVWPSSPTEYGYYRVDLSRLDVNREVVWALDTQRMGVSPAPSNVAVVVRYYNRYFLPICGWEGQYGWTVGTWKRSALVCGISLLLWSMEREGLIPSRRIPIWCEVDHPLGMGGFTGYTVPQRLSILRASTEWLRDFSIEHSIPFILGITTNHTRDSTWGHKRTLELYPAEATPIHKLLIEMDWRGLWKACWHDHSFEVGAGPATYTRHSGGTYGTPANITHPDCNFGTGSTATVILRSETALQVHVEDQLRQMQDLGFAHAWGDNHINLANNAYGGRIVLSLFHKNYGLRSVRALSDQAVKSGLVPTGSYSDVAYSTPARLRVGGVDLVQSADFHFSADNGLYYSGGGDLNSSMGLGATDAVQAYRRFMAWAVDRFIGLSAVALGIPYWHDTACKAAKVDAPLLRFSGSGSYNGYIELVSEFQNAVSLLSSWFAWGEPRQMRAYRARLRAQLGYEEVG